jgi:Mg-chelatase subunit ChlD
LIRVKAAAEQRFEGIALAGRRVVFLVDMSGSMDMVDDKTTDAAKWPGVRDALLRIMRSLPNLEKFQVILFSDRTTNLLGSDGRWIDYDANSAAKVNEALAKVRPAGNTNMFLALDAAFQLRTQGLDTIYLFSDGLPNIGEGVTAEQSKSMTETQRSEILSRVVRNTLKTRWNRPESGRPRVRINAIGFFYESPDVGAFLWALARENDGSFVGMSRP